MDTVQRVYVIYHQGCLDGMAAAWCFMYAKLPVTDFVQAAHPLSVPPSSITNRDTVYLVDFVYPRAHMVRLVANAKRVIVFDHHKTSYADLADIKADNLEITLDMNRCAAQIVWDILMVTREELDGICQHSLVVHKPRPWFINDIAQYDLWQWYDDEQNACACKASPARLTTRALRSVVAAPCDFDNIPARDQLIMRGHILVTDDSRCIGIAIHNATVCEVPSLALVAHFVTCNTNIVNEVANYLLDMRKSDIVVIGRYHFKSDSWRCSIRCRADGPDLTKVVTQFDPRAGGHPTACGFTISNTKLHELFVPKKAHAVTI